MKNRIYPRIRLEGTDLLRRSGVIYSQILNDLLMKVDDGSGSYEKGFFHTSTTTFTEPNYYNDMWSRDVGRGISELARAGLVDDARCAADYILKTGKNYGDHYGRLINHKFGSHEVDGNVNMLMAFYTVWKYGGKQTEEGIRYLDNALPVFSWFMELADESPYGALLASKSELSGNPDTPYFIYALFATYGAAVACYGYEYMAKYLGREKDAEKLSLLRIRLLTSLKDILISRGAGSDQNTKSPAGVWLNGIDERTGKAAEVGCFGPEFDIHRWTRQLPFIQDYDADILTTEDELVNKTNALSYDYIKDGMCEGYFFRRYGFVSNTCFGGMANRHDDTMAGYGQNFFTQAALMTDDVNVYTKCIDGISRLAYDGDIVAPMTFDLNPWVMHECYTYENYEQGLDHGFGRIGDEPNGVMHNPGDEGNLVQSAETLKTFSLVAGISTCGDTLYVTPRLPWECTSAQVKNIPATTQNGTLARISYEYDLDRVENRYKIKINGTAPFKKLVVRLGALPNILCNENELKAEWKIERCRGASYALKEIELDGKNEIILALINEKL